MTSQLASFGSGVLFWLVRIDCQRDVHLIDYAGGCGALGTGTDADFWLPETIKVRSQRCIAIRRLLNAYLALFL
jgi:hypothetical protein